MNSQKQGVHLELVYKDKEQTKVKGIRFCKDGYSSRVRRLAGDYSFGKLNARLEGTENLYQQVPTLLSNMSRAVARMSREPAISESSQDLGTSISSIGLFAPANAQTFETFPEDESVKKKKEETQKRL